MGRIKTPDLEKSKNAVLALSEEDAEALAEWLELLLEVRAQEAERKARKGSA